ncbi:hypothetical protein L5515_007302 [Caenorhabditis briggsae]|uniref:BTB domain-containing protein n=1 Tax=Caenorhabditis briggsae TaxID=6238 RepID=A0AAE9EY36_CAEBR|nr:hypothetical protein L5515_007302 [Caenorhabditis briggsae]
MSGPNSYRLTFNLPVLHDDNGRGYVSMAQEAENVYWRCGVVGVENGKLGIQLMCNSEDRSNFWSMDIDYEAALWFEGKGHQHKTGSHHHVARKYLTLHFPLDICRKISTKQYGMTVKYVVKIMKKVGIREKRIHNFSIREKHISNLALIVEGKTIYCNKEILAMNSEVLMDLVYPDNFKGVQELKLPDDFKYDKLLRLIKLFHDDSDAIDCKKILKIKIKDRAELDAKKPTKMKFNSVKIQQEAHRRPTGEHSNLADLQRPKNIKFFLKRSQEHSFSR